MLDCKWCRQSLSLSKRQNFHWCNRRLTVGFALFSSLRHVLIRSRAAVWIASMEGVRWRWSSITSGLKAKICTNHYQKNETHWALFDSLTVCNCQCRDKLWWLVKKIRDVSLSYCRLLKTFHQLSQTTDFPHSFRKVVPKDTTNWPGSTLKQRLKSCKPIIKCVKPVKAWTIAIPKATSDGILHDSSLKCAKLEVDQTTFGDIFLDLTSYPHLHLFEVPILND